MNETRPQTVGACLPHLSMSGSWHICPWVGCRKHLALTVTPNRRIVINDAILNRAHDLVADGTRPCCQVEFVRRHGESSLEAVGEALDVCRERVRQVQDVALARLTLTSGVVLLEHHEQGPVSVARIESARRLTWAAVRAQERSAMPKYDPRAPWPSLTRGFRMRRLRQRLGWTVSAIAKDIDSSRSAFYAVETDSLARDYGPDRARILDFIAAPVDALRHPSQPDLRPCRRPPRPPRVGVSGGLRLDFLLGLTGQKTEWHLKMERVRRFHGLTPKQMAVELEVSRNRSIVLEQGRRQPTERQRTLLWHLEERLQTQALELRTT